VDELRAVIGEEIPGLAEKNIDYLDSFAKEYIAKCPFLVLSTSDAEGRVDESPKGDTPGFVDVVDERTLLIPDRPGNKLAYGHQNILGSPQVGILMMIPGTSETLRINGRAFLTADPVVLSRLAARGKDAILAIQVDVEECFFHCGKAFIRSKLWDSETWAGHKVSFGEIYAARTNLPKDVSKTVDASIESDYQNNL